MLQNKPTFLFTLGLQTVRDHANFGRISSNMNLILTNDEIPYF